MLFCLATVLPYHLAAYLPLQAEYQEARKDLEQEVQNGKTIEELYRSLKGGHDSNEKPSQNGGSSSAIQIPEELVGVQAYLRWERNGKKNYSPEEQQVSSGGHRQ